MHGSLDPNLVGKQSNGERVFVRHAGAVDLDMLETMARRSGNYLLGSPETFGVRIAGDNDIAEIEHTIGVDKPTLVRELGQFASGLSEIPDAPIDQIKVVARSPDFTYIRVGLEDGLLTYFDDERQKLFKEFGAGNAFRPQGTFPLAMVPVRNENQVETVKRELFDKFYGGHVALKGAAVEIVPARVAQ